MVIIKNKKDVTNVIQDEIINKYKIYLSKDLTIQAHSIVDFDTGLDISLSDDYDELFLKGEKLDNDTMTYFESEMFGKCDENRLIIQITNPSNNDITFRKDFLIGKLYKVFTDNGSIDISFATGINIYSDENISIKSIDKQQRDVLIETLPDGHKRLIVDIT